MSDDLLAAITRHVREANLVLRDDGPIAIVEGALLLRQAEDGAGALPGEDIGDDTFRVVMELRDALGGALLAVAQLEGAGVESRVVIGVLRRGAALAEEILTRLPGAPGRQGSPGAGVMSGHVRSRS